MTIVRQIANDDLCANPRSRSTEAMNRSHTIVHTVSSSGISRLVLRSVLALITACGVLLAGGVSSAPVSNAAAFSGHPQAQKAACIKRSASWDWKAPLALSWWFLGVGVEACPEGVTWRITSHPRDACGAGGFLEATDCHEVRLSQTEFIYAGKFDGSCSLVDIPCRVAGAVIGYLTKREEYLIGIRVRGRQLQCIREERVNIGIPPRTLGYSTGWVDCTHQNLKYTQTFP
jgi:hypothetical protein